MLRLRQLALVAQDLDPVVDDLKSVFGVEVAFNDPGVSTFGLKNAVIPVGHQFVEVVAPIEENTAGGRYLERRNGDGGYMVILQTDDHPPYKQRVDELGVLGRRHEGPPRLEDHAVGHGVHAVGPVHRQRGDGTVLGVGDRLVRGHGRPPVHGSKRGGRRSRNDCTPSLASG